MDHIYRDSPDWIINKKTTINPINKKDNKCFQYAVTVALSYDEIKKDPQRIIKMKHFSSSLVLATSFIYTNICLNKIYYVE